MYNEEITLRDLILELESQHAPESLGRILATELVISNIISILLRDLPEDALDVIVPLGTLTPQDSDTIGFIPRNAVLSYNATLSRLRKMARSEL